MIDEPMAELSPPPETPDLEDLLLIVVGAGIRAELTHRMLGYRLREQILRWQDERPGQDALLPIVCTDLWYLNEPGALARPAVAIGDPETNAATAYLANRLPTAFVIDATLRIQLDLEFIDLHGCLWGVSHAASASAVDVFIERHLGRFLEAVHDSTSAAGP
jgi:hypothetical protein